MTAFILLLYIGSAVAALLTIWAANGTPTLISFPAILAWPVVWPLMLLIAFVRYFQDKS